jgi:pilus assembly protein CpaB
MKTARIVVLTVAVAAGGIAALLAGRSEKPPEPKAEVPKFDTVDIWSRNPMSHGARR